MPSPRQPSTALPARLSTAVEVLAHPEDVPRLLRRAATRLADTAGASFEDRDGILAVDLRHGVHARMSACREARADLSGPGRFQFHLQLTGPDPLPHSYTDQLAQLWHGQPLSALECARIAAELPLMTTITDRRSEAQPLAGTALMITGHFLSDLVHLVDCLAALGAPLEAMTVLQKDYAYRLRHRVHAHLAERGVDIAPSADAEQAVHRHTARARRGGLRCLGLDDGGYLAPVLLGAPELAAAWSGIAEQTMSGIYKLHRREHELPFPVFSVAQSRLKGRIESYWIADKAVSTALSLLPPLKIEGQPALVIGYGNVGEQIAEQLTGRRMRVAVHDSDILRLIDAHEHGYTTRRHLDQLLVEHQPLLVFGATGRTSLGLSQFQVLRRNCFLASVTSGDVEFDLPALRRYAVATASTDATGTCHRLPGGVLATVLAGGRPVNFHETDSISNLHSDLVYAGMLIAADTLATSTSPTPGLDPGWADQVLEDSGLLEHYYERYGPTGHHSCAPAAAGILSTIGGGA